jgi:hypothetical protein
MAGITETLDLDIGPALAKVDVLQRDIQQSIGQTGAIKPRVDTAAAEAQVRRFARNAETDLRKVGDSLTRFGRQATVGVTVPLVAGLVLATKAASNLEEQQNKTNVVFGQSAALVRQFGESASRSIGLSERAALEAAGTYGNLFRAIGLTEQQSAGFSVSLTRLAADLASFNNANPEEVFDALRSGLTGEIEPLRRFGVNLNQARIEQEALNQGLIEQGGELTAAAKAQAAYSIILQDTALAQGDFARTSESLANQTRIARAELENTAADLGQRLLP